MTRGGGKYVTFLLGVGPGALGDSRVKAARAAVTWSRKLMTYTTRGGGKCYVGGVSPGAL